VELSQERLGNWGAGEDGIHLAADLFLSCAGYGIKTQKRPRKRAFWGKLRERFSELQTVWRWSQSPANSSLPEIPVNREIYREFWWLSGP
jgi:hypothetical protein